MAFDSTTEITRNPTERIDPYKAVDGDYGFTPGKNKLLPWQTDVPTSALDSTRKNLLEIEDRGLSTGIESGSAAAKALFNSNTSGFAKALSSRAKSTLSRGLAKHRVDSTLDNVSRQARDINRSEDKLGQIDAMRKVNYSGQLKFADAVANYQQELERAKLGVLGGIIGGGLSTLGYAAGGGFKGG